MVETIAVWGFAEPVSSWLHLGGAAIAAASSVALWRRGETRADRIALAVFGFATVFALSMSGVYHLLDPHGAPREVLRRLDHAGIWLLIAGTFTPVHVTMFRGAMRWGVLAFVWTSAIAGLVLKTIFFARFPEWLGLGFYLGLGWLGALSAVALARAHGPAAVRPLLYGGVAYSVGGVASLAEPPALIPGVIGHHELWHLAVLGALYLHWSLMHQLPRLRAAGQSSSRERRAADAGGRPVALPPVGDGAPGTCAAEA